MSGFVKEVLDREVCIDYVARELRFPWSVVSEDVSLEACDGRRMARDLVAGAPYPAYARSLRDGYAVRSADVVGASAGAPVFLRFAGAVEMGTLPHTVLGREEAVSIPTGGLLPEGADAVVMVESTAPAGAGGEWIEIRSAVSRQENVMACGEEFHEGGVVLSQGEALDFRAVGILATLGITKISCCDLKISILSTGDEIVPVATDPLPPGHVRDVNAAYLRTLLARYGFAARERGIVPDDADALRVRIDEELKSCDVLLLSGGSSVGVRDHSTALLEALPDPGLLVRGVNIVPGKPTLIAGSHEPRKLVLGLPGHPLSCLVVAFCLLIPLLLKLCGARESSPNILKLPLGRDLAGSTGPEEWIPARVENGRVLPIPAKSGYVAALKGCAGFVRLPGNRETARAGEEVELWIW